jgi:hypothetical protein
LGLLPKISVSRAHTGWGQGMRKKKGTTLWVLWGVCWWCAVRSWGLVGQPGPESCAPELLPTGALFHFNFTSQCREEETRSETGVPTFNRAACAT